jgi:hypothetical protein
MKIFTKEILNRLPRLGSTGELTAAEVKVPLKLFNPCGAGTWYITEYNPEEDLAFGFANLGDTEMAELGYVSIKELTEYRSKPFGLGIERDMHFGFDHTLAEVMDAVKSGGHI